MLVPQTLFRLPFQKRAKTAVLGVPFEQGSTFGTGTKFAPFYIRIASENTVEYSLIQKKSLFEKDLSDWGNVDVRNCSFEETADRIGDAIQELRKEGTEGFLFLGGEHGITPATVRALKPRRVAVIDAHLDMEEEWDGSRHSHACAVRRAGEIVGFDRITVLGARSFSEAEIEAAEELGLEYFTGPEIREDPGILARELRKADYLSIDVDGIDPAHAPEVGNPETGGIDPLDLIGAIGKAELKGADIVEGAPVSGTSPTATLLAVLARELLLRLP